MSQPTTATEGRRVTTDELRTLFLFEHLTDDQLTWIATRAWAVNHPTGDAGVSRRPARDPSPGRAAFARHHPRTWKGGALATTGRCGSDGPQVTRTEAKCPYLLFCRFCGCCATRRLPFTPRDDSLLSAGWSMLPTRR